MSSSYIAAGNPHRINGPNRIKYDCMGDWRHLYYRENYHEYDLTPDVDRRNLTPADIKQYGGIGDERVNVWG